MASRLDPTRTTMLRRAFAADADGRFIRLKASILEFVAADDCFALKPRNNPFTVHAMGDARRYEFLTDPAKLEAFRKWLREQIRSGILSDVAPAGRRWTSDYVLSAYYKGIRDAYANANKKKLGQSDEFFNGTRAQFLAEAFNTPIAKNRLELLYTRAFSQLEGVTDAMDAKISTILAAGLAHGKGPFTLAQEINLEVDNIGRKRSELLARTELIYAYSEAKLDAFEKMGIEELGLIVEWMTTGTPSVCPRCQEMAGKTYTIAKARGLIPKHPNCVTGDSIVEASDVVCMTKVQYSGEIVELVTAKGRRLSVTPNHVLLTQFGFVPAKLLYQGLNLIDASGIQKETGITSTAPDNERGKSCIADIFTSLSKTSGMSINKMPTAPEYFHKDGRSCHSEVSIIWADGELRDKGDSEFFASPVQSTFPNPQCFGIGVLLNSTGSSTELFERAFRASDSSMGGCRDGLAFLLGAILKTNQIGLGTVPRGESIVLNDFLDGRPGTIEMFCDAVCAHPFLKHFEHFIDWEGISIPAARIDIDFFQHCRNAIANCGDMRISDPETAAHLSDRDFLMVPFDEIVDIQIKHVIDIPVFDVSTLSTGYVLNGVLSSNCRCTWRTVRGKKLTANLRRPAMFQRIMAAIQ